ncbi:MAG TPA: hypothetical protein HPP97_04955 [Desulfuromonadales bacterium]|nr:hypothetical protein [Desulfuromonadales bacterium]
MIKRFWSGLCMILLLSGCGWDGTATRPNDFTRLTSITISAVSASIANGTSTKLTATGHFSGQFSRDVTDQVVWTSNNEGVAKFDYTVAPNKNRVTAKGVGSAVITATLDGVSATYSLTVSNATINTITITPATVSVPKGLTTQFAASGTFSDTTVQDLTFDATWGPSAGTFATVSNDPASKGRATTRAIGTESISATFGAFPALPATPATLTVTAAVLQLITVTPANPIKIGITTFSFTATGNYSDGTTVDVTARANWVSSQTSVATIVATSGSATTAAAGTTTISATLDGITGITTLTQSLKALVLTPTSVILTATTSSRFKVTATLFDNTTQDVTALSEWTSSAVTVATVNNSTDKGLVSGVATGSATITATYGGQPVTATVTVQ